VKSVILYPDGSRYDGQGEYQYLVHDCGLCTPEMVDGVITHRHPGKMECACHRVDAR
jgi:hypothetical protein